jgi:hypothetical protein
LNKNSKNKKPKRITTTKIRIRIGKIRATRRRGTTTPKKSE